MKFEPLLDKPALAETLRRAYGYPISTLTFCPKGMVGCHYIADCADGRRYFVTLLVDSHMGRNRIARLDFTLALTHSLYERGLFPFQPALHRTRSGALKADFGGQPLVVYDYIEGDDLWNPWPPPPNLLRQLGGLTACLHRATPDIGMKVPYVEQFHLPFEETFLRGLTEVEQVTDHARPGLVELRELILPQRELLLSLLERLHGLGATAQALHAPMVLVHTDLHGGNLIRMPQGELFVVDWEGAMLAPAEHDLFIFAGENFSILLAEYLREAKNPRLYPELFAYYFHRRLLEDVAEFLVSILHEDTTADEDRYQLDLLGQDCLSGLPFLETCTDWAREQIRISSPGPG